jgi:hypothetical protein
MKLHGIVPRPFASHDTLWGGALVRPGTAYRTGTGLIRRQKQWVQGTRAAQGGRTTSAEFRLREKQECPRYLLAGGTIPFIRAYTTIWP